MNDKETIGLLEEMILLIVLKNEAIHGAEVARQYSEDFKKTITLPAIIAVLKRLENKGFLSSKMGAPGKDRGGRRKRLYQPTSEGYQIASNIQLMRNQMWKNIPST
jgi:DNA-binding PadR family transcriptional regulator